MFRRVSALFRAGFQAQWGSGAWPVAPFVMHGSVAAVLCGLVSNELPPFAYALYALSVSAALIALPLLGDFGTLLRRDTASEWIGAQPVHRSEIALARALLLVTMIAALALAALVPAALFAPGASAAGRVGFVALGLGQALCVTAGLFGLQSALGERAEGLLVALQTVLVTGVLVGAIGGLRLVPSMVGLFEPTRGMLAYPPAWFAASWSGAGAGLAWRVAAPLALVAACAVLVLAPPPPATAARRSGGPLAMLLAPVRALAERVWVRRGPERGAFALVVDALPLEREFVLRCYPMLGIPLAFLLAGARGESGPARDGLLSVLLFTPGAYLPILVVYAQATGSPDARWLFDTAPAGAPAIARGAVKGLAVRFLFPLYVGLGAMTWALAGHELALRLVPAGAALSLIVTRTMYERLVAEPPLSVAPDDVRTEMDWTGPLLGLGLGLTVVAVLAVRFIETPAIGVVLGLGLLAVDFVLDRKNP